MSKWPLVPLGELLKRADRFESTEELAEYRFAGTYSFARGIFIGEVKPGSTFALPKVQRIHEGDFVYCKIMAWEGAFGLVPKEADECVMSGAFVAYEPNRERISPRFLDFFFKVPRHWMEIGQLSIGTNVRRRSLHPNQFEASAIPLPPLVEQRQIVARIESLAGKIEEANSLRHQAVKEGDALFDSLLTSILGSANWPVRLLPDVAEIARGKFSHRPRNEPRFYGGQFPFIQIGDISNSNRYIYTYSQTLNETGLAISRMFPASTVVIAITGATIGVTGILTFDSCFPDSIVGIQARPEFVAPEFIYLTIEHAKKKALAEATQTTQPNINLGNLERLQVIVPPLSEQRRIVSQFDALHVKVDVLKKLQAETAAELAALMPSILDKAFKGEL